MINKHEFGGDEFNEISNILKTNESQIIIKLNFIGDVTSKPIISTLIRNHDLTVNILKANIEDIHGEMVGFTVCQIIGTTNNLENGVKYLESLSIYTEILSHEYL